MQSEAEHEAAKCLKVAEAAWRGEDRAKALRFAEKAMRLHPSAEAESLVVRIKAGMKPPAAAPVATAAAAATAAATPAPAGKSFTAQQAQLCQSVISAKDLYAVLGIPRTATEDQIKKAYKKKAMLLHPDKNGAPKAEEAFKKVSKAFQILSDEQARAHYDQTGSEAPAARAAGAGASADGFDFMTPEELFQTFFFGGTGGMRFQQHGGVYRVRREFHHGGGGAEQQRAQSLLQLLPIICLVLFSLLSGNMWSSRPTPDFSLTRTARTHIPAQTTAHQVPFFVSRDYERSYPKRTARRAQTEAEVEYFHFANDCAQSTRSFTDDLRYYRSLGNRQKATQALEALQAAEGSLESCLLKHQIQQETPSAARRVEHGSSDVTWTT